MLPRLWGTLFFHECVSPPSFARPFSRTPQQDFFSKVRSAARTRTFPLKHEFYIDPLRREFSLTWRKARPPEAGERRTFLFCLSIAFSLRLHGEQDPFRFTPFSPARGGMGEGRDLPQGEEIPVSMERTDPKKSKQPSAYSNFFPLRTVPPPGARAWRFSLRASPPSTPKR